MPDLLNLGKRVSLTYVKEHYDYNVYEYTENTSAPYTSLLTRAWTYNCNLRSTCYRTLIEMSYDQYGNVYQTQEWGDYDLSGDERTHYRGYYPNTTAYIVGLPAYDNLM
jgi:hypothetical protein